MTCTSLVKKAMPPLFRVESVPSQTTWLLPTAREGNVFRSVSVILFTGGGSLPSGQRPSDRDPLDRDHQTETPWTQTLGQRPPPGQGPHGWTPLDRDLPGQRPLDRDSPPSPPYRGHPLYRGQRPQTENPIAATVAVGTHPTGMQSCLL